MWIALALLSAAGSAGTGLALKRTLSWGGPVASTVAYRVAAGVLLLAAVAAAGPTPLHGAAYARAVALVIPFELVGTVAMTMALRTGDLSLVQPLFGLLPVVVTLGGAVLLGERPTPAALAGVGLVAAGIYGLGLDGTRGLLAPVRALVREPAARWAFVGVLAWSGTSVIHKLGIAAAGPMPWAVTLAFGSAAALLLVAPLLPADPRGGSVRGVGARARWAAWAAACGGLFAVQQVGLQFALREAPVGYVTALASTSLVLAVLVGVAFLGERAAARQRLGGAALVALGAALVALYG
jgi:drug/metabolite transporter (DMT)-like permease